MRPRHIHRLAAFIPPLMLALAGISCGATQPSKFYLLNAVDTQPANSAHIDIGLGPIEFPAYLDRNMIIVRTGANSFETAEYHRWAEPLEINFTRVLAQNLGNVLPNAVVAIYPWRNGKEVNLQALIEVISFDSDNNNQARLHVRWELIDAEKKTITPPQLHEYIKTARNGDYEARVQAMSECVAALGQELAQEIARITSR